MERKKNQKPKMRQNSNGDILKNSNYDQNSYSKCDKTHILSKTQIVMKLKLWLNSKIQNVMKLKNSNGEKTQKLKLCQNSITQIVTKLKKTQNVTKLKM